jgi:glutamate racemase
VLVFDSGVGGLSVYDEIRQLLPNLHYIYAFDNVAFPYGEKSEEFIVERVWKSSLRFSNVIRWRWPSLPVTPPAPFLFPPCEKFAFPVVGVVRR